MRALVSESEKPPRSCELFAEPTNCEKRKGEGDSLSSWMLAVAVDSAVSPSTSAARMWTV